MRRSAPASNGKCSPALLRVGLAATEREVVNAGGRPVDVVRIRITDDGRKALVQ
jgi:hypothetical protein